MPTRIPARRAAAAVLVTTAVAGVSLAVAAPASAAYGGGYADAWVKGYGGDYADSYVNGYGGDYADNWTDTYNEDYGRPWGGGVPAKKQAKADVSVSASGPAHIDHNQEQLWTVEITNTGKATAQQVRAVTSLPNGITHRAHRISSGPGSAQQADDGRITVTTGALKPGQTVRLQIAGKGPSYGGGTVQLHTQATTTSPETSTGNNTATVSTRIA
ncbi:hypothetical protein P8605_00120 [Streptomyces sp. T-3]|nr:hypothetical protein [Streptomyces sp. T-3]